MIISQRSVQSIQMRETRKQVNLAKTKRGGNVQQGEDLWTGFWRMTRVFPLQRKEKTWAKKYMYMCMYACVHAHIFLCTHIYFNHDPLEKGLVIQHDYSMSVIRHWRTDVLRDFFNVFLYPIHSFIHSTNRHLVPFGCQAVFQVLMIYQL